MPNLNHLRNVDTIINSLENDLDYRYLIADYNGKFLSDGLNLNADYLIPSALVEYLWQRVFDYAGYTYSGNVFDTDAFKDLYLTYPKSIGSDNQQVTVLHTENFIVQTVDPFFPAPGGNGFITFYYNYLFQDEIPSNIYIESFGQYNEITEVLTAGLYQFKLNGFIGFPESESSFGIYYWVNNPANPIEVLNSVDSSTNIDLTINLTLQAGDRVFFGFSSSIFVFGGVDLDVSDLDTSIALVEGDSIDFEEAFIDFKCTDFVKEIMFQFSLTPFTSRFENSILFLTEDEKYLDADRLDWSDKFVNRISTEYEIGYSQKNNFKYKYNNENENHNDGEILINNVNLPEEGTVIQSVTYSPERFFTFYNSEQLLQVKMWDKEIQDDGSIEYKDLRKRFVFLREEDISGTVTIESDIFANSDSTTQAKKGVFGSLNYSNVVATRYNSTRTILNNTKLEKVFLKLNTVEASGLDLAKKYFFKQLGGDYVINKMDKYLDNEPTRFELLKINEKIILEQPPEETPLFLQIDDTDLTSCILTLDVSTNITQPVDMQIRCVNAFIDPVTGVPLRDLYFDVNLNGSQVVFDLDNLEDLTPLNNWRFSLKYVDQSQGNIISNQTNIINTGSCGTAPDPPPTETITITSVETLGVVSNVRTIRINITTDFTTPADFDFTAFNAVGTGDVVNGTENGSTFIDVELQHQVLTPITLTLVWNIFIEKDGVISNEVLSTG